MLYLLVGFLAVYPGRWPHVELCWGYSALIFPLVRLTPTEFIQTFTRLLGSPKSLTSLSRAESVGALTIQQGIGLQLLMLGTSRLMAVRGGMGRAIFSIALEILSVSLRIAVDWTLVGPFQIPHAWCMTCIVCCSPRPSRVSFGPYPGLSSLPVPWGTCTGTLKISTFQILPCCASVWSCPIWRSTHPLSVVRSALWWGATSRGSQKGEADRWIRLPRWGAPSGGTSDPRPPIPYSLRGPLASWLPPHPTTVLHWSQTPIPGSWNSPNPQGAPGCARYLAWCLRSI